MCRTATFSLGVGGVWLKAEKPAKRRRKEKKVRSLKFEVRDSNRPGEEKTQLFMRQSFCFGKN
jgi:hypothetical protein